MKSLILLSIAKFIVGQVVVRCVKAGLTHLMCWYGTHQVVHSSGRYYMTDKQRSAVDRRTAKFKQSIADSVRLWIQSQLGEGIRKVDKKVLKSAAKLLTESDVYDEFFFSLFNYDQLKKLTKAQTNWLNEWDEEIFLASNPGTNSCEEDD